MAQWQFGMKDEARRYYDKAVQWMESKNPRDEALIRFRAEAAALLGLESLTVTVWELSTQKEVCTFSTRDLGVIGRLAWSPDATKLAVNTRVDVYKISICPAPAILLFPLPGVPTGSDWLLVAKME
jgi:hypothetical protein